MACKTLKGMGRKMLTGDGRKDDALTKAMKKERKRTGFRFQE